MAHAPGMVTTFYRMFIGAIALAPFFAFHWIKNRPHLPLKGVLMAMIGGFCFGNDMALWSTGVVASNATIPTIFANTAPIWVGIGSIFIFREKHRKGFWIGLLLALSGIPLMMKNDLFMDNGLLKGALLGLAAGVFYGIFYLVAQTGRKLIDTLSFLFISTSTSALTLLIYVLVFNHELTGYDQHTYLIFLAFGIGVQVFGWFLINYSRNW
jgi:drug/metabolite transporter (DMT)-like permease